MNALLQRWFQPVTAAVSPPLGMIRQFGQQYWQQLSRREQGLVAAASVVLLLWAIWQGVFVALAQRQVQAEQALAASQRELAHIEQQAAQIRQLRASGAAARRQSNQPMDAVVHTLASRYQLTIERVGYQGSLLDVKLLPARFDKLMDWLIELEQSQQIKVHSIRLSATDTSGMVDVGEIQFERQ